MKIKAATNSALQIKSVQQQPIIKRKSLTFKTAVKAGPPMRIKDEN